MPRRYSDEFKPSVIEDYYNSPLAVKSIALKCNLEGSIIHSDQGVHLN